MSMIETLLTVLKDRFPNLRQKKWLLALVICSIFCLLGVPLTTSVGQTILVLLNNYGVGVAIFFYAVFEVVGVTWIYGLNSFCKDVTYMLNKPPGLFWKCTWAFTAPIALMVIFLFGIIDAQSAPTSTAPEWATITGWILAAIALVQIPLWFVITMYKDHNDGIIQKFLSVLKPAENWGPSNPVHFTAWKSMKNPDSKRKLPINLASSIPSAYENQSYREDVF